MAQSGFRHFCTLETLEDRNLLAVTTTLLNGGTTLRVVSDASSDIVRIIQSDTDDTIKVSWQPVSSGMLDDFDYAQDFISSKISRIIVQMGAGDDQLYYQFDSLEMYWPKTLQVDLGRGNDYAFFDFGGKLMVPYGGPGNDAPPPEGDEIPMYDWPMPQPAELKQNLTIDVKGGAGNDVIDAVFGNIYANLNYRSRGEAGQDRLTVDIAGTVSSTARVLIDLDGGIAQDTLWTSLGNGTVEMGGRVTVHQRGGQGNDTLSAVGFGAIHGAVLLNQWGGTGGDTISSMMELDSMSTGRVIARAYGQAGGDEVTMRLKQGDSQLMQEPPYDEPSIAVTAALHGTIHGGTGGNVARITPNIRVMFARTLESSWFSGFPQQAG